MTVSRVCESHKVGASDSFADTLDESVPQGTYKLGDRHAKEEKNHLGELQFSNVVDRMTSHFRLFEDVKSDGETEPECLARQERWLLFNRTWQSQQQKEW